jgi:uncharacterized Zn-finger protein
MQINYHNKTIYCFYCKKELSLDKVFLDVLFETFITCTYDHILGYTYDKEWIWLTANCPYFYVYHNRGQCRCIQDDVGCDGQEENCENLLGKRTYEEDLND